MKYKFFICVAGILAFISGPSMAQPNSGSSNTGLIDGYLKLQPETKATWDEFNKVLRNFHYFRIGKAGKMTFVTSENSDKKAIPVIWTGSDGFSLVNSTLYHFSKDKFQTGGEKASFSFIEDSAYRK